MAPASVTAQSACSILYTSSYESALIEAVADHLRASGINLVVISGHGSVWQNAQADLEKAGRSVASHIFDLTLDMVRDPIAFQSIKSKLDNGFKVLIIFRDNFQYGHLLKAFKSKMALDISGLDNESNFKGSLEFQEILEFCRQSVSKATESLSGGADLTLPEIDEIPEQSPVALTFAGTETGPIELTGVRGNGDFLNDSKDQTENYAEVRFKASEIVKLGQNRTGVLYIPLQRLLVLPGNIFEVRTKLFWSRANSLRQVLRADQDARRVPERIDPDERTLDPLAASQLEDLVETINVFVLGDQSLLMLDAARPGPREMSNDREFAASKSIIEAAQARPDVISENASDALAEQIPNLIQTGSDLHARQANSFARHSIMNFVGQILRIAYKPIARVSKLSGQEAREAWKEIRQGIYRVTGAAAPGLFITEIQGVTNFTAKVIEFIQRNAELFQVYVQTVFQNPTLQHIVAWVTKLLI